MQEAGLRSSPNFPLQRAAGHIKCSAAGEPASCALHPQRARVLEAHLAVAELGS